MSSSQTKAVTIRTNTFKLVEYPRCDIYQHSAFDPPVKSPKDRREYIHRLQTRINSDLGACPYDGNAQLFSMRVLPTGTYRVPKYDHNIARMNDPNPRMKIVSITIQYVSVVPARAIEEVLRNGVSSTGSGDTLHVMTFLNIAVKHGPSLKGFVQTAKSFFPGRPEGVTKSIAPGLEIWRGLFLSMRLTNSIPILNTDITSIVMLEAGNLADLMKSLAGVNNIAELSKDASRGKAELHKLRKLLKGIRVKSTYMNPPRIHKIEGLEIKGSLFQFELSDGKQLTVVDYFKEAHQIRLHYPKLFGIKTSKSAVIPPELLEVLPGQPFRGKLNANAIRGVLDFTKLNPSKRLEEIKKGSKELDHNNSPTMRANKICLDLNPMQIQALHIQSPTLQLGEQVLINVNTGSWDFVRKKVFESGSFGYYCVLLFTGSLRGLGESIQRLHNTCIEIGIKMPGKHPIVQEVNAQANLEEIFKEVLKTAQKDAADPKGRPLIIAVIPDIAKELKDRIKFLGDIVLGVPTQCFKIGKFGRKPSDQYLRLASVKINTRGGGIASIALNPEIEKIRRVPTLIIGADVSHAGPGSYFPSVGGVVGSLDGNFVKYVARCGPQPSRMEQIQGLCEMVKDLIHAFHSYWKAETRRVVLPQRIIFYRDGLSEGEFKNVANNEQQEIKDAIHDYWSQGPGLKDPNFPLPKLIYITAIKRHHIRMIPNSHNEADKSGNVLPGTVTMDEFSGPESSDWFLVSHKGILGTSRPTHYNILKNEDSGLISSNDLKAFTNALCYHFSRATCSVSQVTPVYYADLVCDRAMIHLGANFHEDLTSEVGTTTSMSSEEQREELLTRVQNTWRSVHKRMVNEMYFL